ncbi:MAG: hypothetical protein M1826_004258 [Phylliscum demangeonii]|nr:MAG: hypothetical protein M1826_004258 [Phylliscum demangeonii]
MSERAEPGRWDSPPLSPRGSEASYSAPRDLSDDDDDGPEPFPDFVDDFEPTSPTNEPTATVTSAPATGSEQQPQPQPSSEQDQGQLLEPTVYPLRFGSRTRSLQTLPSWVRPVTRTRPRRSNTSLIRRREVDEEAGIEEDDDDDEDAAAWGLMMASPASLFPSLLGDRPAGSAPGLALSPTASATATPAATAATGTASPATAASAAAAAVAAAAAQPHAAPHHGPPAPAGHAAMPMLHHPPNGGPGAATGIPAFASAAGNGPAGASLSGLVMGGMPPGHGLPTPAGHQLDLNYMWGLVQELGGVLESNRSATQGIISSVEELRRRAAEHHARHGPETATATTTAGEGTGEGGFTLDDVYAVLPGSQIGASAEAGHASTPATNHADAPAPATADVHDAHPPATSRDAGASEPLRAQLRRLELDNGQLRARVASLEQANGQLEHDHFETASVLMAYEAGLARILDMARTFSHENTTAFLGLHRHYHGLLDTERLINIELRNQMADFQAHAARVAAILREGIRYAMNDDGMREISAWAAVRAENSSLRRHIGLPVDDSDDDAAEFDVPGPARASTSASGGGGGGMGGGATSGGPGHAEDGGLARVARVAPVGPVMVLPRAPTTTTTTAPAEGGGPRDGDEHGSGPGTEPGPTPGGNGGGGSGNDHVTATGTSDANAKADAEADADADAETEADVREAESVTETENLPTTTTTATTATTITTTPEPLAPAAQDETSTSTSTSKAEA